VLTAALLLMAVDRARARRRRESPEELQRRLKEFDARLASPKWTELERHFGAPAPRDLQGLYTQPLVCAQSLETRTPRATGRDREDFIAWFCPADLRTVEEASWVVQSKEFPFANDGFGNYYVVAFGQDPAQPSRVRFHSHEGGGVEDVGASLDEFLGRARPVKS
jgi:hypothetical protein